MAHRKRNTCVRNRNWPCVLLMGLRVAVVNHSGESSGAGRARICLGERPRSGVSRVKDQPPHSVGVWIGCPRVTNIQSRKLKTSFGQDSGPDDVARMGRRPRDRPRALRDRQADRRHDPRSERGRVSAARVGVCGLGVTADDILSQAPAENLPISATRCHRGRVSRVGQNDTGRRRWRPSRVAALGGRPRRARFRIDREPLAGI